MSHPNDCTCIVCIPCVHYCNVCGHPVHQDDVNGCSDECRVAWDLHCELVDQKATIALQQYEADCTTKCVHYCGEDAPCSEECRVSVMEARAIGNAPFN